MEQVAIPLSVAFVLGFGAQRVGLPPLVGYLAAGFVLHEFEFEAGAGIEVVSDLGVLLLLFGIGLKLRLSTLARPVVWAGTTIHLAGGILVLGTSLAALGALGVPLLTDLSLGQVLLLAFALGFSSTVYAVKALESYNEAKSLAGSLAVAVLVMQDVFAVAFLVAVGGLPSPWASPVIGGVGAARPLWHWLVAQSGYEELLLLLGLVLALGVGAAAFEAVEVKPDLGALLVGMLLASHPKAIDLSRGLLGLKDVLLVGFFLSIGLGGLPEAGTFLTVGLLVLLIPAKTIGHLLVFSRFGLRARTVWHTSVTLANYSEFGLIVIAVSVREELLDPAWATAMAVLVAVSFAVASPPNRRRYELYDRLHDRLVALERRRIDPLDALIDPGEATVLVFGMGRVGEGAFEELLLAQRGSVAGVDRSQANVDRHIKQGRRVVRGDAMDSDFWERLRLHPELRLIVLAMNDHRANMAAARRIRTHAPRVAIAAVAKHHDEVAELRNAGVDVARNLYEEAGQGLADDAVAALGLPARRPG